MVVWHVEPVLEDIHCIDKSQRYFALFNQISEEHLGLELGDLETLCATRLALFLIDHQAMDLSKVLIAYAMIERLLEFEDNLFCAAMYRRKLKDLSAIIIDISERHGISVQQYMAS